MLQNKLNYSIIKNYNTTLYPTHQEAFSPPALSPPIPIIRTNTQKVFQAKQTAQHKFKEIHHAKTQAINRDSFSVQHSAKSKKSKQTSNP